MKKAAYLLLLCMLCIPAFKVQAQEYTLKAGKETTASYAGEGETDYHYFKMVPSKSGFAEIKIKTSNGQPLTFAICDAGKEPVADQITVKNKKTVLHKVEKGKTYYIRTKGQEGQTHSISYKINKFGTLTYAKKYTYTFTNASFYDQANAMLLKFKAKSSGNMNFMCKTDANLAAQYLNSKKKTLSNTLLINDYSLTGIGVKKNSTYYIKLWKVDGSKDGTTTISNMKYQIKDVDLNSNKTRGKAKNLSKGKNAETLLVADKKTTTWYRIKLTKKKALSITVESRLLQSNGNGLQLYICNKKGKVLHDNAIVITEEANAYYKKKYKMEYPKKKIKTGVLPAGTYYIKVSTDDKKTSGSYRIKWN